MLKKQIAYIIIFLIITSSGCKIFYPSKMLRTPPNYQYDEFPQTFEKEYKIAPNDIISFNLFTNDGYQLINSIGSIGSGGGRSSYSGNTQQLMTFGGLSLKVEFDGLVKVPIFGRIKLSGLTLREAEKMLEEKFKQFYNNPFVLLQITNQNIFIFPGGEGSAQVFTLQNTNTTLFEVLAQIGGISGGKAHRIKLIRGDLKNPKVYLIDLSSIDGMKEANLVLQANDIIYIEPVDNIPERFMRTINPYLSFITTISTLLLTYSVLK